MIPIPLRSITTHHILLLLVTAAVGCGSVRAEGLTVAKDGTGDVRTVQEAIDKVPAGNARRFDIVIKPGIYNEQIRIPANKPFISIIGTDPARTILTFKLSNKDRRFHFSSLRILCRRS